MCWYHWFSTSPQKAVIEDAHLVQTMNICFTNDRNDSCCSTDSYYSFESDRMEKKNDKRTISTHSDSQTHTSHQDQISELHNVCL